MALRPAKHLPARFRRKVSSETLHLVRGRHERASHYRWERYRRLLIHGCTLPLEWVKSVGRWGIIGVFSFLLLLIGLILLSPLFRVRELRILRTDPRLDVEQMQSVLAPLFGVSMFSVSQHQVNHLLDGKVFGIEIAEVKKTYPSTVLVRVTLEPAVARLIFSDGAEDQVGSGSSLREYLSVSGRYTASPVQSPELEKLPIIRVVDWSARPIEGGVLLPPPVLAILLGAERVIVEEFGQEVVGRLLFLRARELHLDLGQFFVWLDLESPLDEQLWRYRAFLQAVGISGVKEYIDLRLSDRVAYQ